MLTSSEIRQKYKDFFKKHGHVEIDSASILPENDSTTLFIGSGMQPLLPYLLGEKHPEGTRLVNAQKCFRTEDIDEVGDHRHNTFFEMLGNWSLGDYFKEEQLNWVFDFLINEIKLNPDNLYVSVFRGNKEINIEKDNTAIELWKDIFKNHGIEAKAIDFSERDGMQGGKIFAFDEKKNWWSRAGVPKNMPVNEPGGPDSELFYDIGADLKLHENSQWKDQPCHINCDCGRFIEIGNSVFMEYIKTENGFEKLPQKNVDFGGGLERITMAVQGKTNIYETDLFSNVIAKIQTLSNGKTYQEYHKQFEIIADHIKAATFIMGDDKGVSPSNTDQGYIVRRILRRAIKYGMQIGISSDTNSWTDQIANIIIQDYQESYPELEKNKSFIISSLIEEEKKFAKTLERGLKEFNKLKENHISGKDAFNLYQTYGFPLEMTEEMALENGKTIDKAGFSIELEKHQNLSKTASAGKFKGGLADHSEETQRLHTAAHLLLAALRKVLGEHVSQKGSNITAERLRFDFSHPEKMTDEQKQEVERLVTEAMKDELPISYEEMTLSEAKEKGAVGVFESKYDNIVKVYKMGEGEKNFSYEICGGPHVKNTRELGTIFKIKKEQSSSSGVRRIKAILK